MVGAHTTSNKIMENKLFKDFIEATAEEFRILETEYGFKRTSQSIYLPECEITYKNPIVYLSITQEVGSQVWVTILKTDEAGKLSNHYHVGKVIKRVAPERAEAIEPSYVFGKRSKDELKSNIAAYVDFLRNEGRAMLQGDFSIARREDHPLL